MSENAVKIRAYEERDKEDLIALWRQSDLLRPWNDPEEDIALFHRSAQSKLYLAIRDKRIVGSLCLGWDGHRAWPYYLAVAPACRNQGIARRLMKEAEEYLVSIGAPKMNIVVRGENDDAIGFYQSIGYEKEDRILLGKRLIAAGEALPQTDDADGALSVTITFLHMLARPTKPAPPKPSHVSLSLLHAVNPTASFYRFLYDSVGGPWLWYERRLMPEGELIKILQDPKVEVFVLYVEGTPAGYFELDRRNEGIVDLAYFGLMPEFIGHKLGPFLLGSAIDMAWSYDPEKVTVNTCTLDHHKALSLYQKLGFQAYDQVEKRIPDPRNLGIF